MADGGFATGLAGGMEAAQQLQLGKLAEQQRNVQLQTSQIQLDALKRMMSFTQGKQFQQELASGPSGADSALAQLEAVQFGAGMTEAGAATARARYEQTVSQSLSASERAMATSRTAATVQQILAGVDPKNPATLASAKLQLQWVLPQDADPRFRKYLQNLTMDQLPQSLQMAKIVETRARAAADEARARADAGRSNLEAAESRRASAQTDLAEAQRAHLQKEGALQPKMQQQLETEIASKLEAAYPMPETEATTAAGSTDATARRANWKARYASVAGDIADQVQVLMQRGMPRAQAIDKAYKDAEAQGRLKVFDAMAGNKPGKPPGGTISQQTLTQYAEKYHMSLDQAKQSLASQGIVVQ